MAADRKFISMAEQRRAERMQRDKDAIIDALAEQKAALADAELELSDAAVERALPTNDMDAFDPFDEAFFGRAGE